MVEVSFSPKKCSKLEMKASDYLNSMENSVFQFTVSDFCLVEPSLINDVLLITLNYHLQFLLDSIESSSGRRWKSSL